MPFEPLRFIHAANVFLDRPLRVSIDIPADVREMVEDATLIAFRNTVQAAVEREVDFVLLAGNTFVEGDRSLQARITLRKGLQALDEAEIPVFVAPGEHDSGAAWRAIPGLPESVAILDDESSAEPHSIERDGRVIATIGVRESPTAFSPTSRTSNELTASEESEGSSSPPESDAFRIRVCRKQQQTHPSGPSGSFDVPLPQSHAAHHAGGESSTSTRLEGSDADYLAVGDGAARTLLKTDVGLHHHPGALQPLSATEGEAGGCTLVDVEPSGEVRCTLLPTAPVRFVRLKLPMHEEWTREELLGAMRSQLDGHSPQGDERLRVIEWRLSGTAGGDNAPGSIGEPSDLLAKLPEYIGPDSAVRVLHGVTVLPGVASSSPHPVGEDSTPADPLMADFVRELPDDTQLDPASLLPADIETAGLCTEDIQHLQEASRTLNGADIITRARARGHQRLQHAAEHDALQGSSQ